MGILTSLLAARIDRSPTSDYWYTPIGSISKAGIQITEDQILRISAVLQGVRFISQTVASLPKFVYQHLEDGRSRKKDAKHYLNRFLRYQPNPWQTAFQFVETMTANAMLKGFGWAERVYDEKTGELLGLWPLEPKRLVKWEQMSNGELRYTYRLNNGSPRTLRHDQLFVLPGFSIDGVLGLPLVTQMREAAGLEVAIENYGASFFANSAMPRVVLTTPKAVSQPVRERMRADWVRTYGGDEQHSAAFLEEDTKVNVLSTNNDEAQFVESRRFLIAEFSRYLDVTPHRLSDMEKSSYNNMEQMSLETVVYSLTPWVRRWEQCCYRDLLTEDEKESGYFIEFVLEGLLRGDTAARAQFYKDGINGGWLTRNEVREKENYNPLDGLDDPLQPQNMMPVGQGMSEPMPQQQDENGEFERAYAIARAAAERVCRREIQAIMKYKERGNGNHAEWRKQIEAFYQEHIDFTAKAMAMEPERAKKYCETQCKAVLEMENYEIADQQFQASSVSVLVSEALRA